jgi:hypothetical protein
MKINEYIGDPVGTTDNEGYHRQIEVIFDKVPTAQGWVEFIKYIEAYDPDKKQVEICDNVNGLGYICQKPKGHTGIHHNFTDDITWTVIKEEASKTETVPCRHCGMPIEYCQDDHVWRHKHHNNRFCNTSVFTKTAQSNEPPDLGLSDEDIARVKENETKASLGGISAKEAQGNLYTRLKAIGINVIEENESKLNLEGSTTSLTDSTFGMRNGHKEANLFTFTKDGILSISNELTGAIKEALKEHILCEKLQMLAEKIIKNI